MKKIAIILVSFLFLGSCAHHGAHKCTGCAEQKTACSGGCKTGTDAKDADCGCNKAK